MTPEESLLRLDGISNAGSEDLDITGIALAIAAVARGGLELGPCEAHLAEIASAVRQALAREGGDPGSARTMAMAVRAGLHGRFGYEGDSATYDDLRNADLAAVIERRRGLPVALGILAIHAARAIGASSHGINFPGHFLVGIGMPGGAVLIDPFHGGRLVDGDDLEALLPKGVPLAQEHLAALSDRGTLIRLQANIVSRARAGGAWPQLAVALEVLRRLAPDVARYRFELGEAYAQSGQPTAARAQLREALLRDESAEWAGSARALLASVSRSLN